MTAAEYISQQPTERQPVMQALHQIIINTDPSVTPVIEPMMGKEMIIYKENGIMKYGLASVKNHMSVHCLPIYGYPALHARYSALLPGAKFQKGCINFTKAEAMPPETVEDLFAECAKISMADMFARRNKK